MVSNIPNTNNYYLIAIFLGFKKFFLIKNINLFALRNHVIIIIIIIVYCRLYGFP